MGWGALHNSVLAFVEVRPSPCQDSSQMLILHSPVNLGILTCDQLGTMDLLLDFLSPVVLACYNIFVHSGPTNTNLQKAP